MIKLFAKEIMHVSKKKKLFDRMQVLKQFVYWGYDRITFLSNMLFSVLSIEQEPTVKKRFDRVTG